MDVQPPTLPADHPDRKIHCVERLEPSFEAYEKAAVAAGWSDEEVAVAMMDLAKNRLLALAANRQIDGSLAALAASKRLDEIAKNGI